MFERPWYQEKAQRYLDELTPGGAFVSTRVAARILGISKSEAATFMRWFKSVTEVVEEDNDFDFEFELEADDAPASEATITEGKSQPTWVADGLIYTDLGPDFGIFTLTKRDFQAARKDYTRLWGGSATQQTSMAYRYAFPSAHAVAKFVQIHGWRQNSIPHTDEEIEELGVDAAVEETIASKRQSYMLKLQERERADEKKDAEKWRHFEMNAQLIAQHVQGAARETHPMMVLANDAAHPYALFVNLNDLHYGKLSFGVDGQRVYTRQEAARRARLALQDLIAQSLMLGRPEEIWLLVGSDFLHIDNLMGSTTKLTNQAGQTDGDYREIMSEGAALLVELVKSARSVAPVRLVTVPGNHDMQSTLFLSLLMQQAFNGDARVRFEDQADGVVYYEYGNNSVMMCHGEHLKDKDCYRVISAAAEDRGLPLRRHKLAFTGHFHVEKVADLGGVKLHTSPSLSEPDSWHRQSHYTGSTVEAQAFVIRRSGGKAAVFYSDPEIVRMGRVP